MGKMSDFAVLMVSMVEALFAFFVVAPCILNAVSLFGVQKRFANVMVEEGIVTRDIVKLLHPKKQIAGVVISVVVLGALVATCIKTAPMGYLCGGVALVAGFLKYRKITSTTASPSSASATPIRIIWTAPSSTSTLILSSDISANAQRRPKWGAAVFCVQKPPTQRAASVRKKRNARRRFFLYVRVCLTCWPEPCWPQPFPGRYRHVSWQR